MLSCLQALAEILAAHANQPDFAIDTADIPAQARRELRNWIRRALVTEREGRIHETDALKTALRFVAQLARRWQRSDWREAHLLPNPGAWRIGAT